MSLTTATVEGYIPRPRNAHPGPGASVSFRMTGFDTVESNIVAPMQETVELDENWFFSIDLFVNSVGVRGTQYVVSVKTADGTFNLANIEIPGEGVYRLSDLLGVTPQVLPVTNATAAASAQEAQDASAAAQSYADDAAAYAGYRHYATVEALKQSLLSYSGAGSVAEGDYVVVRGGGFVFRVLNALDTSYDHITEGGAKLRAVSNTAAAWDLSQGALSFDTQGFNVAGVDNAAGLGAYLQYVIDQGRGSAHLPDGLYAIGADLTLPVASEGGGTSRKFRIIGQGACGFAPFDSADGRPTGTTLALKDGVKMIAPIDRGPVSFEGLNIVGRVGGEALIKSLEPDFNNHMQLGGGFRDCLVINDHKTAPAANTVLMDMSSLFLTECSNSFFYGRTDARQAWLDAANASEDLYHGTGWRIYSDGAGALGNLHQLTWSGFEFGIDVGYSVAEGVGPQVMDSLYFRMSQFGYCDTGALIKQGVKTVEFDHCHWEYISRAGVQLRSKAGVVRVKGGGSGHTTRTGPPGDEFLALGMFVCGSAVAAESSWHTVHFDGHNFRYVSQSGVFLFGGAGDVIIDDASAYNNGGVLVAIDSATMANGVPNILIRNLRAPDDGFNKFLRTRLVAKVTRGAAYSQHSFVDDQRYLARIENCGTDSSGVDYGSDIQLPVDLDLGTRKWPPFKCHVNTQYSDRNVTLGDAPPIGMEMTIEKRTGLGNLNVIAPSGVTLRDNAGNSWTGATAAFTAVGHYVFARRDAGEWTVQIFA